MIRRVMRAGALALVLTTAALLLSSPASADTGGGCRNLSTYTSPYYSDPYVCISTAGSYIIGDFYLNAARYGERSAQIKIEVWCNNVRNTSGETFTHWVINSNHSPQHSRVKPCTANGRARTLVTFLNSVDASGSTLYQATSPWQYW